MKIVYVGRAKRYNPYTDKMEYDIHSTPCAVIEYDCSKEQNLFNKIDKALTENGYNGDGAGVDNMMAIYYSINDKEDYQDIKKIYMQIKKQKQEK